MAKRQVYQIADKILLKVAEGPVKYSTIQKSTGTNYDTVKMHIEQLQRYGLVSVKVHEHDAANGKPSYEVTLTQQGKSVVKRLKDDV